MTPQTPETLRALPRCVVIRVRYLGATDRRPSRWCATYRRSADQTFRAVLPIDHGPAEDRGEAAALACLARINADRRAILPRDADWQVVAAGHDHDAYFYLAAGPEVAA